MQSLSAYPLARLLKITLPDPDGFFIVGANPLARTIAKELLRLDKKVVVADMSMENIAKARLEEIPFYLGNPISEHTDHNPQLFGLGTLLALSESENENIAAAFHFREEFGKRNIYTLPAGSKQRKRSKLRDMQRPRGTTLFSGKAGYSMLSSMLEEGASIQQHVLGEKLTGKALYAHIGEDSIPLFAADNRNNIHFFNDEHVPQGEKGWRLFYLGFDLNSEEDATEQDSHAEQSKKSLP